MLPIDLLFKIFDYLENDDLIIIKCSNKSTYNVATDIIRRRTKKLINDSYFDQDKDRFNFLNDKNFYIFDILARSLYTRCLTDKYLSLRVFFLREKYLKPMIENKNR